jgi:hypothetical protein
LRARALREPLAERFEGHRLDQVMIEPGFVAAAPVLVLAPAGQREHLPALV